MVPHDAFYQNCTAKQIKGAAIALDKKCIKITSTEQLVQIQNNFTELFLMMPSTKIAHMVALG